MSGFRIAPVAVLATALMLIACGGESPAPRVDGPALLVDGIVVQPSATVRQGQSQIVIVISRAGGGLSRPAALELGGLIVGAQSGSTDRRLALVVSVPHGAALGRRALRVATTGGVVTAPDLIEVAAITAGPAGADTNLGTPAAPFRSLKAAIAAAGEGDTIALLDGVYDDSSGETWGYLLPPMLTLAGQSPATQLVGQLVRKTALIATGDLTIKNLSLEIPVTGGSGISAGVARSAIRVSAAAVKAGRDAVVLADGCVECTLDIADAELAGGAEQSHAIAIGSSDGASLGTRTSVRDSILDGDIFVDDRTAALSVTRSRVAERFANDGVYFDGATLDVTDTSIDVEAEHYGVHLMNGAMSLSGVTITGGTYGVFQTAGSGRLQGTKILDYEYVGYYLETGLLDLGTASQPGNNELSGTPLGYCLFVARLEPASPVTSSATSYNGAVPAPGDLIGEVNDKGRFFINTGQVVSFY